MLGYRDWTETTYESPDRTTYIPNGYDDESPQEGEEEESIEKQNAPGEENDEWPSPPLPMKRKKHANDPNTPPFSPSMVCSHKPFTPLEEKKSLAIMVAEQSQGKR